jgi:hypothetical protein
MSGNGRRGAARTYHNHYNDDSEVRVKFTGKQST